MLNDYRQMLDPNVQVGQQLVQLAAQRYQIDLRDEKQRQAFGRQNAIAGYIAGEIIPGLNDPENPLKPNEAMTKLLTASREAGVDPRVSIGIYEKQMEIISKQAGVKGASTKDYITDLRAKKLEQEIYAKTPAGIQELEALKEGAPIATKEFNKLKINVQNALSKKGKTSFKQFIDRLADTYPSLEGKFKRNIPKNIDETASMIAASMIDKNQEIAKYFDFTSLTKQIKLLLKKSEASIQFQRATFETGGEGLEILALPASSILP